MSVFPYTLYLLRKLLFSSSLPSRVTFLTYVQFPKPIALSSSTVFCLPLSFQNSTLQCTEPLSIPLPSHKMTAPFTTRGARWEKADQGPSRNSYRGSRRGGTGRSMKSRHGRTCKASGSASVSISDNDIRNYMHPINRSDRNSSSGSFTEKSPVSPFLRGLVRVSFFTESSFFSELRKKK